MCSGCYHSFSGWWCDNCDQWPCICNVDVDEQPPPAPEDDE
jgi:hypothetical protein